MDVSELSVDDILSYKQIHSPSVLRSSLLYESLEFSQCQLIDLAVLTIRCMDLTTLGGDDAFCNVARLCFTSMHPLPQTLLSQLSSGKHVDAVDFHTGAICVYPSCVNTAKAFFSSLNPPRDVNIAAVATGFPSGQYSLSTRLGEIKYAISEGANEIDIVVQRSLVLDGKWHDLFSEIRQCKQACGDVHMKTILSVGELGSFSNVYKASMVAMLAGSDFIKTSTGKEAVNATIPVGLVMCRAIRDFYDLTGVKVGLKPAGGVRTLKDAVTWFALVDDVLGKEWLNPSLFRIGASGLLGDVQKQLYRLLNGRLPDEADMIE